MNIKIKTLSSILKKYECEVLIFMLIFFSNEGFIFGVGKNELLIKSKFFINIFLFIIIFLRFLKNKKGIPKKAFFYFVIMTIIICLSNVINNCFDIWTFWRIFLMLFSLILVSEYSLKKFLNSYINVISILSIIALISYFAFLFFPAFIKSFPIDSNYIGYNFYSFFGLNYIPVSFNSHYGIRNYSIFREPGVFACYLGIALLFLLLGDNIEQENKIKKIIIFSLAMITTLSTAGILSFVLLIFIFLLKKNKNKNISRLIILLLGVILFYALSGQFDLVFDKLFNTQSEFADSKNDRFNGIYVAFELISRNPILGVGITNFDISSKLLTLYIGDSIIATDHYTISLLKIFAQTGIVCFVIYLFGLYNTLKQNCNQKIITILSFFVLIIIFSNEDFTLNILLPLLVFYGLVNNKKVNEVI